MQLAVLATFHPPSDLLDLGVSVCFSHPLASISYFFMSISNVNACGVGVIPILALWDGF